MKKPSNPKTGKKEHNHYRWALTAFVMAVALSGLLSLSSEAILENAGLLLALLILALFIGLGILFDIIGVAVTAADPRPFHSMAAHKEPGAKEARLRYETLGAGTNYTLVEVELLTGRHHQIRAQLSKIGCPIRGDLKYGARRSLPGGGISLHSRRVEFEPPVRREPVSVTAPAPADDNLWAYFETR